jgi:hypothetical protein
MGAAKNPAYGGLVHHFANSLLMPVKFPAQARKIPCFAVHKFATKPLL